MEQRTPRLRWLVVWVVAVVWMVAVLGRQIALEFRRLYPIEIRNLPFDIPRLHSIMLWHRRFDDHPAHRWLRETAVAVGAAI